MTSAASLSVLEELLLLSGSAAGHPVIPSSRHFFSFSVRQKSSNRPAVSTEAAAGSFSVGTGFKIA
jgi:hypothetical protein